jgi:hypothetical protein
MIPFAPFMPDQPAFEVNAARDALNVIPAPNGYRPFQGFVNVASAITARAQGAVSVRGQTDGAVYNFCGDATKLYRLDADGNSWTDVTRSSGVAYATATDGKWSFTQFGDFVIATNGVDAVQYFELGVSTKFEPLAGSPPISSIAGVIRGFVVLARVSTQRNRIKWSAIEDPEDYVTSALTLSDAQDFPEGGAIVGFVGGEYGLVLQEKAIQRMSFEGPPTVFRFDKLSSFLGCREGGSIANFENMTFFLSDQGFYMIRGGSEIIPIGDEKVDRWFEANLDASYIYRMTAAVDPINKLYVVGFPNSSATSGTPNTILMYHWPTGKWSYASVTHEILFPAATQTTYTIDGMDAVAATIDELVFPVDSRFWTGSGRLLLSGFDSSHQFGYFSGANLAATIETGDEQITPGRRTMLRSARPMIEGTSVTPSIAIGWRNRLQDAVTYADPVPANESGVCPSRVNARYHRGKIAIPAGDVWTFARGLDDLKLSRTGGR